MLSTFIPSTHLSNHNNNNDIRRALLFLILFFFGFATVASVPVNYDNYTDRNILSNPMAVTTDPSQIPEQPEPVPVVSKNDTTATGNSSSNYNIRKKYIYQTRKITNSKEGSELVSRMRQMVIKQLNNTQILTLLNIFSDLLINKFPTKYLDNEMGERFLNVLTADQKIQFIAAYSCYEINLAEAATFNLFLKTQRQLTTYIQPAIKEVAARLSTFEILGMTLSERKLFVFSRLNLIFTPSLIQQMFIALQKSLTAVEKSAHANCGGRIIMFNKYFKITSTG